MPGIEIESARERADRLRRMHHHGMLVLPNAWDAASAAALADAGFRAVATASNAISASLGYPDGEVAPWEELFFIARRIAATVDLPVTVDAEAGYGMEPQDLVERLLATGAVGCNLEDSDHRGGGLRDLDAQAAWLAGVSRRDDAVTRTRRSPITVATRGRTGCRTAAGRGFGRSGRTRLVADGPATRLRALRRVGPPHRAGGGPWVWGR